MSFNAEWTNADALAFRPYTAYASAPVTYSAATDPMSDLQRENAELRELARDLYECGDSCTHCRHWNQGDGFYCDLGVGWKARRMRELGVEIE